MSMDADTLPQMMKRLVAKISWAEHVSNREVSLKKWTIIYINRNS